MDAAEQLVRAVKAAQEWTAPRVRGTELSAALVRVARCAGNRAPVRLLLACALAKACRPELKQLWLALRHSAETS
ncbi:hypothetical protein [Deinococcus sp.]|uniref:hypothetical protein n=1 Tax=Deinococcus sp. TaxID=47478 RepID=UPI003CC6CD19